MQGIMLKLDYMEGKENAYIFKSPIGNLKIYKKFDCLVIEGNKKNVSSLKQTRKKQRQHQREIKAAIKEYFLKNPDEEKRIKELRKIDRQKQLKRKKR